jgi:hypothetical protein
MRRLLWMIIIFAFPASFATGETITLMGDQRWIVTETFKSRDFAIAEARDESREGKPARVLKQKDGRFAVVLGPATVKSDEDFLKADVKQWSPKTKNPQLSRGEEFLEQAYIYNSPILAQATLDASSKDISAKQGWGNWGVEISATTGKKD